MPDKPSHAVVGEEAYPVMLKGQEVMRSTVPAHEIDKKMVVGSIDAVYRVISTWVLIFVRAAMLGCLSW